MATVESSITGTTAVSLGGLVLAGTGCVYAFHGEIMEFIRKASGAVIALGLGLAAVAAVTTLFAATGATV